MAIERTLSPVNGGLASDGRSIDALQLAASKDPKAAIRETAKQFEALFMQQLMMSMRQATMSSGMLDNAGSELGTVAPKDPSASWLVIFKYYPVGYVSDEEKDEIDADARHVIGPGAEPASSPGGAAVVLP